MRFDALVFGSATIDVFLTSSKFQVKGKEKKLLQLPHDVKLEVGEPVICSGGGGTNVAVGLSRLGLRTAAIARLGQDCFASFIIDELSQERVWTKFLSVCPGERTDYSTVLVGPDGRGTVLVSRGKTRLEEENIPWKELDAFWFHLSSLEGNLSLAKKIINFAKERGIRVSWNPGIRELLQKDKLISLLEKVELLILNEQESKIIARKKTLFLPVSLLVVTRGKKGVSLVFPREKKKMDLTALPAKLVEATGAGDAFCSGFIGGLIFKKSFREAALWGMANSSSVIEFFGAKAGLLTRRKLRAWLKKS